MSCNQVKKDEGASCARTEAAVHSKKDRDNVAAPDTLSRSARQWPFATTELTRIRAALRSVPSYQAPRGVCSFPAGHWPRRAVFAARGAVDFSFARTMTQDSLFRDAAR
jgi:hypothetical protein